MGVTGSCKRFQFRVSIGLRKILDDTLTCPSTTNFDYADPPTTVPLNYMATPEPKQSSYSHNNPVEHLHARFGEGILPSEEYLGQENLSGGRTYNYASAEEYNTLDKYPLAYNNSVFNEQVSNHDLINYPGFAAAVHHNHSFRTMTGKAEGCETIPTHNPQGQWHSATGNHKMQQRPDLSTPFQGAGSSYGRHR